MSDAYQISLPGGASLLFMEGDLTRQNCDAIVNAANSSLMGGGGVDGAIHRAGGPAILEECKKIVAAQGHLPPGEAVSTTGGRMPAAFVIHTVGPVWHGGMEGEAGLLANAYRNSLRVADRLGLRSVAFPAISTGVYGYPAEPAAEIAVETVLDTLAEMRTVREVRFVFFGRGALDTALAAVRQVAARRQASWHLEPVTGGPEQGSQAKSR